MSTQYVLRCRLSSAVPIAHKDTLIHKIVEYVVVVIDRQQRETGLSRQLGSGRCILQVQSVRSPFITSHSFFIWIGVFFDNNYFVFRRFSVNKFLCVFTFVLTAICMPIYVRVCVCVSIRAKALEFREIVQHFTDCVKLIWYNTFCMTEFVMNLNFL